MEPIEIFAYTKRGNGRNHLQFASELPTQIFEEFRLLGAIPTRGEFTGNKKCCEGQVQSIFHSRILLEFGFHANYLFFNRLKITPS
ncbi:MAG TPA: hypothetical protein VNH19_21990 [Candidatus Limnocylindrales bacterium]|nr:hypothetical protein [Candidatus Limnocylindrales bacterium]